MRTGAAANVAVHGPGPPPRSRWAARHASQSTATGRPAGLRPDRRHSGDGEAHIVTVESGHSGPLRAAVGRCGGACPAASVRRRRPTVRWYQSVDEAAPTEATQSPGVWFSMSLRRSGVMIVRSTTRRKVSGPVPRGRPSAGGGDGPARREQHRPLRSRWTADNGATGQVRFTEVWVRGGAGRSPAPSTGSPAVGPPRGPCESRRRRRAARAPRAVRRSASPGPRPGVPSSRPARRACRTGRRPAAGRTGG